MTDQMHCTSLETLRRDNLAYRGTTGLSAEACGYELRPAFLDRSSGQVHLARFADGRLAPMHLLDGLPGHLVGRRSRSGRVLALKRGVVAGFERWGRFYTREEAALIAA